MFVMIILYYYNYSKTLSLNGKRRNVAARVNVETSFQF